ncbi:hypothetical protein [Salibaculum griseiflavum]|uniref:Lipoprotein n=1 Tax=Salibaculum griseiflavum TaxID=1914409 RepID=A0A2V1P408_9RHOB|nr:hypothetical protein [Salibaculum griseiflavum]PWG17233.1 hypothetical protein DFK10_07545 [Salibaculum griseiflavum]
MNFLKKCAFGAAMVAGLSGCELAVIAAAENNDVEEIGLTSFTMPAMMLLDVQGEPAVTYTGTLVGHMTGRGDVNLTGSDGTMCEGSFGANGRGTMVCDDVTLDLNRGSDARNSLSGADYISGQVAGVSYQSVFAWGRGANVETIQLAMSQRRSLSAGEVRDLNPR